jgi:hypothetical protein
LQFLRKADEARVGMNMSVQVAEMQEMIQAEEGDGEQNALSELLCPKRPLMHAMLVGLGAAFFQQANGSEVNNNNDNGEDTLIMTMPRTQ